MKKIAQQGLAYHAPRNTRTAIIAAYVSGADGCSFNIQMTRDEKIVVFDKESIENTPIYQVTSHELSYYDMSRDYRPEGSDSFRYFHDSRYRLKVELLKDLILDLPNNWLIILNLPTYTNNRHVLIKKLVEMLKARNLLGSVYFSCPDAETMNLILAESDRAKIVIDNRTLSIEMQLELADSGSIAAITTDHSNLIDENGELTVYGEGLARIKEENPKLLGAFTTSHPLGEISKDTIIAGCFVEKLDELKNDQHAWIQIEEAFEGKSIDTANWSFGYAKANSYCHVYQNDGVHIAIKPFTLPYPEEPSQELEKRVLNLENQMEYALKTWPWYSGGGVGLNSPIVGDFVAQVDYQTQTVSQNITLEMAVVNVNPGAHQRPWNSDGSPRLPRSNRDKDSFYDPHGAPPYIGVEHDENDGYRVNWNYGSDYDNNGYGPPVGDGQTPRGGSLLLVRRGPYFSTYYKNSVDAPYWVCSGVQKNESLNSSVFLRCVGKRWGRQRENVEFVFRNIKIKGVRHLDKEANPVTTGDENYVRQ